jgi:hypothetical protein
MEVLYQLSYPGGPLSLGVEAQPNPLCPSQSLARWSRIRAEAWAFFFVSDLPLVLPVFLSTIAYFEPRFRTV